MGAVALALLTIAGGFPDYLYENGEYQLAAGEYLRVIWEAGDTLSAVPEALGLARCWQETGRPLDALGMYAYLAERLPAGHERGCALMGAATVFESTGLPLQARGMYLEASSSFTDAALTERCLNLAALSLGRAGDWGAASDELGSLAAGGSPVAARLLPLSERAADPPRRSPLACGLASAALPGLGQAVCGHWTDAMTSLLMTAGTAALTVVSVEEDDTAGSVFFGWLALSFYGGGIWGAARGADRYNEARLREILEGIPSALDSP